MGGAARPPNKSRGWARMNKRMHAPLAVLALALAAAVLPGTRGAGAEAAGAADASVINRVENYLNSITTLRASFLQVAPDGSVSEGMLYLARPGRVRIEYDPPATVLMVSDGARLIYLDREIGQVSELPLSSPLAQILLRKQISLGDNLEVVGMERQAGVLRVTLAGKGDPGAGTVTLVFNDNPLALRQWLVRDGQGLVTRVTLMETWFGLPIDSALFDPPGSSRSGAAER